ncbi:MAG: hypothetical protein Q9170_004075 [Blastenia crenularia]
MLINRVDKRTSRLERNRKREEGWSDPSGLENIPMADQSLVDKHARVAARSQTSAGKRSQRGILSAERISPDRSSTQSGEEADDAGQNEVKKIIDVDNYPTPLQNIPFHIKTAEDDERRVHHTFREAPDPIEEIPDDHEWP